MGPDHQKAVRWLVSRPHGMLLVTGPTGCGKTTTQYSLLSEIHSLERNFVTIEDPVEMTLPRVNQIQVQPRIDLTFSSALRHILRQDPDVILVGEIRDPDTARLAVEASLTGHLVMATLHTNDSASAATRLSQMGVAPFLIAASLLGVVNQRLVRRICPDCAEEYIPSNAVLEMIGFPSDESVRFMKGTGCARCRMTGYYGRTGIFEVLRVSAALRDEVAKESPVAALRETARLDGFQGILQSGFEKVVEGATTLEEVVRVVETLEG
jgi:type IV pilus assembly protein PilB